MKIGFDVDGVLADFNSSFIRRIIQETGRDLFPARPFDIPCWNYPQVYGYTTAEISAVWDSIKSDVMFWWGLAPYSGVPDVLRVLNLMSHRNHDIYFVTARPGDYAKLQTEQWLRDNGMSNPTVLISSHKMRCAHALELDAYIDDHVQNCFDVADHCRTYVQHRPWNAPTNPDWQAARTLTDVEIIRVDHVSEMIADLTMIGRL